MRGPVGNGYQLGARTIPVAADMDRDGITDVGLYVPDGTGGTGTPTSQWFWIVSDDPATDTNGLPLKQLRKTGTVNVLQMRASPSPFSPFVPWLGGNLYAAFGNTYAEPVVGNFDPPINPSGKLATTPAPLTVNLAGTPGNDNFVFGPGTKAGTYVVSINGVAQTFSASSIQVNITGQGGTDTAVLHGIGAGQQLVLRPGSADLTGAGYHVHIAAANITADPGKGSGTAAFYGVAGKTDYFYGYPSSATMSDLPNGKWKTYIDRENGYGTVNAYSAAGEKRPGHALRKRRRYLQRLRHLRPVLPQHGQQLPLRDRLREQFRPG